MGSKLSGGMGMSRVGTILVGGVMSGHRNSIDRSGKIEAYYYELGLICIASNNVTNLII